MNGNEIYHEIINLRLDHHFVSVLKDFISRINPFICWEEFGRIPVSPSTGGAIRFYKDLYYTRVRHAYSYLSSGATHEYLLKRLTARRGPNASILFKFLCMNAEIDERDLNGFIGREKTKEYVEQGIFIRRRSKIVLPVTLVPYRNYCYLSEGIQVLENQSQYGIRPAHLSYETHRQVMYLRRWLKHRRVKRMLEMGSGIGIVSLEMRDIACQREGAEIYERNIEFAQANKQLREDTNVSFYQSDLFSNVKGKFDLIIFNPWQPAERCWDVIKRFLQEAPAFLTDEGNLTLCISSGYLNEKDLVVNQIREILEKESLCATRDIFGSQYNSEPDGRRSVTADSYLRIRRSSQEHRTRRGTVIETNVGLMGIVCMSRKALSRMVG